MKKFAVTVAASAAGFALGVLLVKAGEFLYENYIAPNTGMGDETQQYDATLMYDQTL